MFCRKCGCGMTDDSQFCPKCGTPIASPSLDRHPESPSFQRTSTAFPKSIKLALTVVIAIVLVALVVGFINWRVDNEKTAGRAMNAAFDRLDPDKVAESTERMRREIEKVVGSSGK